MKIAFLIIAIIFSNLAKTQTFIWGKQDVGGKTLLSSMSIDKEGNVYSAIQYTGIVDFDPGAAELLLEADSRGQAVLQKLDSDGNFGMAKRV